MTDLTVTDALEDVIHHRFDGYQHRDDAGFSARLMAAVDCVRAEDKELCREVVEAQIRRVEQAEAEIERLREALTSLRNECRGLLGAFRVELMTATSVTNVRVLERKVAEADAALGDGVSRG